MPDPLATIAAPTITGQQIPVREDEVMNSAGGYVFSVSPMERLRRFLILGTTGGTYYASERELTAGNAGALLGIVAEHGEEAVAEIVRVSTEGRAPKQQPTMFALALASVRGDDRTRRAALDAVGEVCRTATHLFLFLRYRGVLGGGDGRGLRRAVSHWYLTRPAPSLGYQAVKYRQREGWTHRDALRIAHPLTSDDGQRAVFDWLCRGTLTADLPDVIDAYLAVQEQTDPKVAASIIRDHGLPWEAVPDALLNEPAILDALLDSMPTGALLRQVNRLTRAGVLIDGKPDGRVLERLSADALRKARAHPLNVLNAQRTYAQGRGFRGTQTWTPVRWVVDELEAAFYRSFGAVAPSGKRMLLALDVSGSMQWANIEGTSMTPAEASAVMAMVALRTEPHAQVVGFSHQLVDVPITAEDRLGAAVAKVGAIPMGGTDCSLPMLHALARREAYDAFQVYTDNETWAGQMHPFQALQRYRAGMGIPAKLIVQAFTATDFTIADPNDGGMLDVVGFDANAPQAVAEFLRA